MTRPNWSWDLDFAAEGLCEQESQDVPGLSCVMPDVASVHLLYGGHIGTLEGRTYTWTNNTVPKEVPNDPEGRAQ